MLYYDTETASDSAAIPFLPAPEAPSNYKDAEKVAAYKAELTAKQISRMALVPSECRIVALAWDSDGTMNVALCQRKEYERVALRQFWGAWYSDLDRVGYNAAFDLPVLITRSRILGVPHPKIDVRKYGTKDVRDLMLELSFGGVNDYRSLNFWCQRFGLEVPTDPNSGKDIAALVDEDTDESWGWIRQHVMVDVLKTKALAEYLNLL